MVSGIAQSLGSVRERIAAACSKVSRDPDDVTLVAVSKTHPAETVRAAIAAGATVFGENKVQEGVTKSEEIDDPDCEWHLIGHLQSNKARKALQSFDVIQTVDSVKLAKRLDRIAEDIGKKAYSVFVQIDLGQEVTKSGVAENELEDVITAVLDCGNLQLDGLMTIPPYFEDSEDVRPYFQKLAAIRDRLRDRGVFGDRKGELSMGMSHDFEVAIEEGSTIVRVGTAIFGARE